jgi:hypothetical protein
MLPSSMENVEGFSLTFQPSSDLPSKSGIHPLGCFEILLLEQAIKKQIKTIAANLNFDTNNMVVFF